MNFSSDALSYYTFSCANHQQDRCIYDLIAARSSRSPDSIAIAAPGRAPLTYGRLHAHIQDVVKSLNAMGICRNDRVAIVLPDGPEMAVAFLSVAAGAASAPLNPAYRASEYDFYLSDLGAKAIIFQSGTDSPAVAAAQARGIPVIELSPVMDAEAGIFTLKGSQISDTANGDYARADDVALVLHTSGTTSRPKIVPLTHANICISANNVSKTLKLTESDRCLNVMPLFHIHGLIGALLSSLSAGASVVCTPGFYAPKFFEWMEEFQPTWYTAVPTMHQSILARSAGNRDIIKRHPLRFVRSSSAPLPPRVMADLEDAFGAPVIESYGMTEAAHQMTSNPLPPGEQKPGSAGVASGPEVAIMSENGDLLPHGKTGEIVIRGANVMHGYENNPDANEKTFTNGWFRTGDQGYMDSDNYLFITGRLKEIINRAGEKISPQEVDEALMAHPDVVQAVTFAVPHARLGEDVAAAVVLRDGVLVKERRIQEFAAERLADFKVPRRIVILDEIPKGPTGKLQRIGLAEKLGLDDASSLKPIADFVAPRTSAERKLAKIWAEVIGIQQVGIQDNFFDLGGDSRTAAQMLTRVQRTFGKTLPLTTLFHESTVEQMAGILSRKKWSPSLSTLVPIQTGGSRPPFFCIHGCFCEVTEYFALARHLGQDQPLYGLRARGIYGEKPPYNRIEAMAAHYIREMKTVQPEGPYFIGTSGGGGLMALEVAQQLVAQGQEVGLLILIDSIPHILFRPDDIKRLSPEMQARVEEVLHPKPPERRINRLFYYLKRGQLHRIPAGAFRTLSRSLSRRYRWRFAYSFIPRHSSRIRSRFNYTLYVMDVFVGIQLNYVPGVYPGRITYFRAEQTRESIHRVWHKWAGGGLDVHVVPGSHHGVLREPHVRVLAEKLRYLLDEAQRR